jgi:hypothetical protein
VQVVLVVEVEGILIAPIDEYSQLQVVEPVVVSEERLGVGHLERVGCLVDQRTITTNKHPIVHRHIFWLTPSCKEHETQQQ